MNNSLKEFEDVGFWNMECVKISIKKQMELM